MTGPVDRSFLAADEPPILARMDERDPLLDFVSSVSGESHLKVDEDLGDGFVRLKINEAERRQAKHDVRGFEDIVIELLRNSRDAHAHRIFVATCREGDTRHLVVIDDGLGVPTHLQERIFEPRVTSKLETMVMDQWGVHGRGMALFSVRSNTSQARVAASDANRGLAMLVAADVNDLPERADQSTWPTVEAGEDGRLTATRGPHNIARRIVEFALEHPAVDVWMGSPAETVATLHATARAELGSARLLFTEDATRVPVWQRPALAADAAELVETAAELGLGISERTAHRILSGQIAPTETVAATVSRTARPATPAAPANIYKDRRGLKIAPNDLAAFSLALTAAFDDLAEQYYLHLRGEPRIVVGRDEISVRFSVDKEE
jgi:hypothetical protein